MALAICTQMASVCKSFTGQDGLDSACSHTSHHGSAHRTNSGYKCRIAVALLTFQVSFTAMAAATVPDGDAAKHWKIDAFGVYGGNGPPTESE